MLITWLNQLLAGQWLQASHSVHDMSAAMALHSPMSVQLPSALVAQLHGGSRTISQDSALFGQPGLTALHKCAVHSALRKEDGTFAPAHLLADSRLERAGRASNSQLRAQVLTLPLLLTPAPSCLLMNARCCAYYIAGDVLQHALACVLPCCMRLPLLQ